MFLQFSKADSLLGLGLVPLLKTKQGLDKLLNADTQTHFFFQSFPHIHYTKAANIYCVPEHNPRPGHLLS